MAALDGVGGDEEPGSGIGALHQSKPSILHSGASRIEIELNKHEKFITLQFSDNGRGFDTSRLDKEDNKGMGISNIETRVKSIEGVFILESNPGKGTSALIKVIE